METVCRGISEIGPAVILLGLAGSVQAVAGEAEPPPARLAEIPVVYDGPGLGFAAAHASLAVEEVVRVHSVGEYLVHIRGFTLGFPYLGGMDERIATPWLKVPRVRFVPISVDEAQALYLVRLRNYGVRVGGATCRISVAPAEES